MNFFKKREAVKRSTRENSTTLISERLCLFQSLFTVGTCNSPPITKTNRLFRIFPYRTFMFSFVWLKSD